MLAEPVILVELVTLNWWLLFDFFGQHGHPILQEVNYLELVATIHISDRLSNTSRHVLNAFSFQYILIYIADDLSFSEL